MGFYLNRENYNLDFAKTHYQVLHEQPVPSETDLRRSFFRINDEEELLSASFNWIHFPCVVMVGLSGGPINKAGSIRQGNNNIIMFLDKVALYPANPVGADAISRSYELTFEVMRDYISKINEEHDEELNCGDFQDIELEKFQWEQCGPIGDEMYGWILSFSDEIRSSGMLKYFPSRFITT